jgi:hypothetical protein
VHAPYTPSTDSQIRYHFEAIDAVAFPVLSGNCIHIAGFDLRRVIRSRVAAASGSIFISRHFYCGLDCTNQLTRSKGQLERAMATEIMQLMCCLHGVVRCG